MLNVDADAMHRLREPFTGLKIAIRIGHPGSGVCSYQWEPVHECSVPSALVLRYLASDATCIVGLKREYLPNNLVALERAHRRTLGLWDHTGFERMGSGASPYQSPSTKLLARARLR